MTTPKNNPKRQKHIAKPITKNTTTVSKNVPKQSPKYWWYLLAVLVITFVVFIPSLSCKFVNWDDPNNLYENESLKIFATQWSWVGVKQIFSTHVIGNYNPLTILTFAIEQHFFAPDFFSNPFIFHFNNVWMHVVCTLFVFLIFRALGMSTTAVVIGSLLFGIHPMRVESVTWVTERKDVLYGMFFLAALWSYIKYIQQPDKKTKWYVLAIFLSIFSYLAKIQAVTLPLTMVAVDFYLNRKWKSPKILIIEKMPWWLMSLACGLINIYFLQLNNSLGATNAVVTHTFLNKLAIGAYSYAIYVIKWIFPYRMSPLYPYTPELPIAAYVCLVAVPVLLIALIYWSYKNKKNAILFGVAFFTFNVMFLLQIVSAGQGYLADRFTYIAYIGLFFLTAKFYDWITQKYSTNKFFIQLGFGAYLVLFAFMNTQQQKIWQNGGVLWEKVKTFYANSPVVWKNAASYYRDEAKNQTLAIYNYEQALLLTPEDAYAYNDLGKALTDSMASLSPSVPNFMLLRNELLNKAINSYDAAVKYDSIKGMPDKKTAGEILVNRGALQAMMGNLEIALLDLNKGLNINPDNINGYSNRAVLYSQTQRFDLAIKDRDKCIELNPGNADYYYERGLNKFNAGMPTQNALADINTAISINANNAVYYLGRAYVYKKENNRIALNNDVEKAKSLGLQIPADLLMP